MVGFTGSVASIKDFNLLTLLKQNFPAAEIKAVYSKTGYHFRNSTARKNEVKKFIEGEGLDPSAADLKGVEVLTDEDEWKWDKRGDPVLSIDLVKWADLLLIAPLSANSLAKIANGMSDNLLVKKSFSLNHPSIHNFCFFGFFRPNW